MLVDALFQPRKRFLGDSAGGTGGVTFLWKNVGGLGMPAAIADGTLMWRSVWRTSRHRPRGGKIHAGFSGYFWRRLESRTNLVVSAVSQPSLSLLARQSKSFQARVVGGVSFCNSLCKLY